MPIELVLACLAPYAGMIRIRFNGLATDRLSAAKQHPVRLPCTVSNKFTFVNQLELCLGPMVDGLRQEALSTVRHAPARVEGVREWGRCESTEPVP